MKPKKKHSFSERMSGINDMCSLSTDEIHGCDGYQMVGERACDNRLIPGFKNGDIIRICKYHKKWVTV